LAAQPDTQMHGVRQAAMPASTPAAMQQAGAAGAGGSYAAARQGAGAPATRGRGRPCAAAADRRRFDLRIKAGVSTGSAAAAVSRVLDSIGLELGSVQVLDATYMGTRPDGHGRATRIVFTVGCRPEGRDRPLPLPPEGLGLHHLRGAEWPRTGGARAPVAGLREGPRG
jgi:hypothetical protein